MPRSMSLGPVVGAGNGITRELTDVGVGELQGAFLANLPTREYNWNAP